MAELGQPGELRGGIGGEPRESRFVLPPVERPPLADRLEKRVAILRVIAQAERERARGAQRGSEQERDTKQG